VTKTFGLSKSRITAFLQCPKRLWLEVHRPELKEETEATQVAFAVGHQVGEAARAQYPKGILVGHDDNLSAAVEQTKMLLMGAARTPIFEATFQHQNTLARADLMLPWGRSWHLAEVKSTGGPKPYHLNDLAVQSWVAKESGVPVARATVRHIDMSFVYPGGGNYRGLFVDAALGAEMKDLVPKVPDWVNSARATLGGPEPRLDMGAHCDDPYACPFKGYCQKQAGPQPRYPVEILPGLKGKKLAREFRSEGLLDLRKVPSDRFDGELLARIHEATVSGKAYRDAAGARKAISAWKYPRAYLDFETIAFPVPIWQGTKPYQQVPFQWSCHIGNKDGAAERREFLDLSGQNPSRACAERLLADLSGCRTIVAYHAPFERAVIHSLADAFPDMRRALRALAGRVCDLLPMVRDHYYHRQMEGSFSLKAVLPALAPKLDYAALEHVQDGSDAQQAYLEVIHPLTANSRKAELEKALRQYCRLDSRAMIAIERALCQ
jgi:hypothetical protein